MGEKKKTVYCWFMRHNRILTKKGKQKWHHFHEYIHKQTKGERYLKLMLTDQLLLSRISNNKNMHKKPL